MHYCFFIFIMGELSLNFCLICLIWYSAFDLSLQHHGHALQFIPEWRKLYNLIIFFKQKSYLTQDHFQRHFPLKIHKLCLGRIEDSLLCWKIRCIFSSWGHSCRVPACSTFVKHERKQTFQMFGSPLLSLILWLMGISGLIFSFLFHMPAVSHPGVNPKPFPWSSPDWQSPICIITNSRRLLRKRRTLMWLIRSRASLKSPSDICHRCDPKIQDGVKQTVFGWLFCCFSGRVSFPASSYICCTPDSFASNHRCALMHSGPYGLWKC